MALRIFSKLARKPPMPSKFLSSNHYGLGLSAGIDTQSATCLKCHCEAVMQIHITPRFGFSTSTALWAAKSSNEQSDLGHLIYSGSNGQRIKLTQSALYTIGGGLVLTSPLLLDKLADHPFLQLACAGWLVIFGLGNPFLFYKFSKRYVLELYHDKENDRYTAVTISPFVFGSTKIIFSPEECRMPAAPTPFTTFLAKNIPLLVSSDDMSYNAYLRMLRYASEFDYENPERQSQYTDAVQEAIQRIGKVDDSNTETFTEKTDIQDSKTDIKSEQRR